VFVLEAQRRDRNDKFAPAVIAQVRVLGSEQEGWALGVLGRYKTEGFALSGAFSPQGGSTAARGLAAGSVRPLSARAT